MTAMETRLPGAIEKYLKIMESVQHTDVSQDTDFQRLFNGYYRMRQRSPEFYKVFYSYLEQQKHNRQLTFHDVLSDLYAETGTLTPSFSSKLLATVRPEMPVWDKFVLQNLGLKAPYYYEKDRMQKTEALYSSICQWYETPAAQENLNVFERIHPNVPITDVKKIDFILWLTR